MILDYRKNSHLNYLLNAQSENAYISFDSVLNNKNKFTEITAKLDIPGERTQGTFSLKNKKFDGNLNIQTFQTKYNYETGEYSSVAKEIINIDIDGYQNSKYDISNLNAHMSVKDNEKEMFNSQVTFNNNELKIKALAENNNGIFQFDSELKWNSRKKSLTYFDIQSNYIENKYTWNQETWEKQYT